MRSLRHSKGQSKDMWGTATFKRKSKERKKRSGEWGVVTGWRVGGTRRM